MFFSDKTGTLTENKMEFQCASVGGLDFSNGETDSENGHIECLVQVGGIVLRSNLKVKTDLELLKLSKRKYTDEGMLVYYFFMALATCNTIVPLTMETSDSAVELVEYQGESPDEQALVYAAASYGFMLIERTSGHIFIDIQGDRQRSVSYCWKLRASSGFFVPLLAAFFVPLLAYWDSDVDGARIGDLWTIGVVILVNVHLAMDVILWHWATHLAIWGSIIATFICVIVIDTLPFFPGYWALFNIANTKLFWVWCVGSSLRCKSICSELQTQ